MARIAASRKEGIDSPRTEPPTVFEATGLPFRFSGSRKWRPRKLKMKTKESRNKRFGDRQKTVVPNQRRRQRFRPRRPCTTPRVRIQNREWSASEKKRKRTRKLEKNLRSKELRASRKFSHRWPNRNPRALGGKKIIRERWLRSLRQRLSKTSMAPEVTKKKNRGLREPKKKMSSMMLGWKFRKLKQQSWLSKKRRKLAVKKPTNWSWGHTPRKKTNQKEGCWGLRHWTTQERGLCVWSEANYMNQMKLSLQTETGLRSKERLKLNGVGGETNGPGPNKERDPHIIILNHNSYNQNLLGLMGLSEYGAEGGLHIRANSNRDSGPIKWFVFILQRVQGASSNDMHLPETHVFPYPSSISLFVINCRETSSRFRSSHRRRTLSTVSVVFCSFFPFYFVHCPSLTKGASPLLFVASAQGLFTLISGRHKLYFGPYTSLLHGSLRTKRYRLLRWFLLRKSKEDSTSNKKKMGAEEEMSQKWVKKKVLQWVRSLRNLKREEDMYGSWLSCIWPARDRSPNSQVELILGLELKAMASWFSIFNSYMMAIFLTELVSLVLTQTMRNDYAKYAREDADLETLVRQEFVHGDVFRTPRNLVILPPIVGTSVQLALLVLVILLVVFGVLYVGRGAIVYTFRMCYALIAFIYVYVSRGMCSRNEGKSWIKTMILTTSLFLFMCFGIGFILNTIISLYGSCSYPIQYNGGCFVIWTFIIFLSSTSCFITAYIFAWKMLFDGGKSYESKGCRQRLCLFASLEDKTDFKRAAMLQPKEPMCREKEARKDLEVRLSWQRDVGGS